MEPVEAGAPSDLRKERSWPSLPEAARLGPAGAEAVPRLRGQAPQALALLRAVLRQERGQAPVQPAFVDRPWPVAAPAVRLSDFAWCRS